MLRAVMTPVCRELGHLDVYDGTRLTERVLRPILLRDDGRPTSKMVRDELADLGYSGVVAIDCNTFVMDIRRPSVYGVPNIEREEKRGNHP